MKKSTSNSLCINGFNFFFQNKKLKGEYLFGNGFVAASFDF